MKKKGLKARWTAREFVSDMPDMVVTEITIHDLAELGFKHAVRILGNEHRSSSHISKERYLAMSKEDKRREYEKRVQEMLVEISEAENRGKHVEEMAKMISTEVVTGSIAVTRIEEEKTLQIVDKKLVQKIATEAKKLVYEEPKLQKALAFKELLTVAKDYGLDENWLSTATYLLIEEIALKQWLLQHEHSEQSLRNKNYKELLDMLETDFEGMGRPISPRAISRFLGERLFRNKVLHEGYNPTSSEAEETKEMAISLLGFLKQH